MFCKHVFAEFHAGGMEKMAWRRSETKQRILCGARRQRYARKKIRFNFFYAHTRAEWANALPDQWTHYNWMITPGVRVSKWLAEWVSRHCSFSVCSCWCCVGAKQVQLKISHLFRMKLNANAPRSLLLDRVEDLGSLKSKLDNQGGRIRFLLLYAC